jgi:hypothetical protein
MHKRISDWLRRVSTGPVTLLALAVFLAFGALVLPQQADRAAQVTGDVGSPDMSFFYSPADLYAWAEAYGPVGRQAYVRARFTFDLVFPAVYLFFLATAVSWVTARAFPGDSLWQRANLAPVVGTLFDFLENVSASVVMLRYPARTSLLDLLAPMFTFLKWLLLGISFLVLVVGLLAAGLSWRRSRAGR